ncbi:MAG: hypothetical protein ACLR2E_08865 [Lachnospiraceae bacterium]
MAEIADETKRSIVTVTGVTSELDLLTMSARATAARRALSSARRKGRF